jgi:CheY-like chemotaxis protein
MRNRMKIFWLDDDPKRKSMADNLAKQMNFDCAFENIKNKNFLKSVLKYLNRAKGCHLIILDHRLNQVKDNNVINGASVAEIFRQKIPGIPIISITAVDISDVDTRTQKVYDMIVSGSRVSENYSRINSLTVGYQTIRKRIPKTRGGFYKLLKIPEIDQEKLYDILPDDFKMGQISRASIKQISDWIRRTLIAKPGFLFDEYWAATYSGVKFGSFKKIENKFRGCGYLGVFANSSDKRWWKSLLVKKILALNPDYNSIYPWEAARRFRELSNADFSKCECCKKPYPEIVGFTDEQAETPIQLHLECSVPHPKFKKSLFFEEIRIIKENC